MPYYTNAKPHVPALFQEIIRNQNDRAAILLKGDAMTQDDWRRLKELSAEMAEYRRGAEKALHHNVDKGATA